MPIKEYLPILQIIVSIVLIILILIQQRGQALGSAFGGQEGFYGTRRGVQKKILQATVVSGSLFVLLAFLNLVLK